MMEQVPEGRPHGHSDLCFYKLAAAAAAASAAAAAGAAAIGWNAFSWPCWKLAMLDPNLIAAAAAVKCQFRTYLLSQRRQGRWWVPATRTSC